MKFCMITTFYGPHSFGGDAVFVERLSESLARHGHEVHVISCRDAYQFVRGHDEPRSYQAPEGVHVHELASPARGLSPLLTHQTGHPALKRLAIGRLVDRIRPDVLHFHNISLIGGPGLLGIPAPGAVRLMTAHEHWLICPLSVLWKFDRGVCERPQCVSCCVQAGRPPQLWRGTGLRDHGLKQLDALICPSESARRRHREREVPGPIAVLPYFLPDAYERQVADACPPRTARPYLAMAGRLEKIKGFQDVLALKDRFPDLDVRIAGQGRYESELRRIAADHDGIHFHGPMDQVGVAGLFAGARAVVVPSLVPETFGYVVLEAFAGRKPVIVRELGSLPELVNQCGGGLTFGTADELVEAIDRVRDPALVRSLGESGWAGRVRLWNESRHLERYFGLIDDRRRARRMRRDTAHARRTAKRRGVRRSLAELADTPEPAIETR